MTWPTPSMFLSNDKKPCPRPTTNALCEVCFSNTFTLSSWSVVMISSGLICWPVFSDSDSDTALATCSSMGSIALVLSCASLASFFACVDCFLLSRKVLLNHVTTLSQRSLKILTIRSRTLRSWSPIDSVVIFKLVRVGSTVKDVIGILLLIMPGTRDSKAHTSF